MQEQRTVRPLKKLDALIYNFWCPECRSCDGIQVAIKWLCLRQTQPIHCRAYWAYPGRIPGIKWISCISDTQVWFRRQRGGFLQTSVSYSLQPEVRGYQFFESVSDPYPQRTIHIRTFLQIDIRIWTVFKVRAWSKQTECETTPIGGQVATGLLYCNACRLSLWDSDAVFIT